MLLLTTTLLLVSASAVAAAAGPDAPVASEAIEDVHAVLRDDGLLEAGQRTYQRAAYAKRRAAGGGNDARWPQPPPVTRQASWEPRGPAPAINGQVENIDEPHVNPVVGAVQVVLAHPSDADVVYAGSVNGGIWRTESATSDKPHWEPLTNDIASASVAAMAFDAEDKDGKRLVAGFGAVSSFARAHGHLGGLIRSDDAGGHWTALPGPDGGLFVGDDFRTGVLFRGSRLIVSPLKLNHVFRSTDDGESWTIVRHEFAALTLAQDHAQPRRVYIAGHDGHDGGGGIYASVDDGATWALVSDERTNALWRRTGTRAVNNAKIAVSPVDGRVWAVTIAAGKAADIAVCLTPPSCSVWRHLDLPGTRARAMLPAYGLNPGNQGALHFSLAAHPTDADMVFACGDRQDGPFPNSLDAHDYSGRCFRGNASVAGTGLPLDDPNWTPSPQWAHITHSSLVRDIPLGGTRSTSAPHADSRHMTFAADGRLIESDDGGVYVRTQPLTNAGDWQSLIGDLGVAEAHDAALDCLNVVPMSGNQDTGTTQQVAAHGDARTLWNSVSTADGGDVMVAVNRTAKRAYRYSSNQVLGGWRVREYDEQDELLSEVFLDPQRTKITDAQFVTPTYINRVSVDGERLVVLGVNTTYESLDRGATFRNFTVRVGDGPRLGCTAAVYGGRVRGRDEPGLLYVSRGDRVVRRDCDACGEPKVTAALLPGTVVDMVAMPDDGMHVFALAADNAFSGRGSRVVESRDGLETYVDITGDLHRVGAGVVEVARALTLFAAGGDEQHYLAVGTNVGVWVHRLAARGEPPAPGKWQPLAPGLPAALVFDLDLYECDADTRMLVAGTMGRGTFTLDLDEAFGGAA